MQSLTFLNMDWFEPLVLIILLRNLKSRNKESWQFQLQTILRDIEIRIIIEEYELAGPYSRDQPGQQEIPKNLLKSTKGCVKLTMTLHFRIRACLVPYWVLFTFWNTFVKLRCYVPEYSDGRGKELPEKQGSELQYLYIRVPNWPIPVSSPPLLLDTSRQV